MRKTPQPKAALHQGIITIAIKVTESAISQHQVYDQDHGHLRQSHDEALGKVSEGTGESFVKAEPTEQHPDEQKPGVGRQALIFESQLWKTAL